MSINYRIAILCISLGCLSVSGCGVSTTKSDTRPAAGTIEGQIQFNDKSTFSSIHLCQVVEYSPGISIDETSIDWSGLYMEGLSTDNISGWQGDVHAPGFACTVMPNYKFDFEANLPAASKETFTILNVPPGEYSFVVIINLNYPRLVYSENNVPTIIELAIEHGIDIGLHTINLFQ